MNQPAKIGVYLCQCGKHIEPRVDLKHVESGLRDVSEISLCRILAYPCLSPGLSAMRKDIRELGLTRVVVAGCSARLMMKKMERELSSAGMDTGRIAMVNIRDQVAGIREGDPASRAERSRKLIRAAVADLAVLVPSRRYRLEIDKPVLILGDGVASWSAAQELARKQIECILAVSRGGEGDIRLLHEKYPGERHHYGRLRSIMKEVEQSPLVTRLDVGAPLFRNGRTGDYTVTFAGPGGGAPLTVEAGLILVCLDGVMETPGEDFGYNGEKVMSQVQADERLWTRGLPEGRVVFWVNDHEAGTPEFAHLSMESAWALARFIREKTEKTQVTLFVHSDSENPLAGAQRRLSRKLGVRWETYDGRFRPTVQNGFITYISQADDMERELAWDHLVLSPVRAVGEKAMSAARLMNLDHREGKFLRAYHAPVRPENIGRKESILAGSAAWPCNLHQALAQGRRAAGMMAETVLLAREGKLFSPAIVSVVDPDKCVGCGQCEELCECGAIQTMEGEGGGLARFVDPYICTGGGTGAAACPYGALSLQNATTFQREAAVSAISRELAPVEVLAFGCSWGGFAAADNAGKTGMDVDPRLHMIQVPCIGQIDASVMAKAFVEGASGLILFGCMPEDCHHSFGVDHGWARVNMIKKLLDLAGFDRRRIALAHTDFNHTGAFVKTVKAFTDQVARLGPVERTRENLGKLHGMYDTVKNPRVRLLISAALRRPWENVYRGNQRHALDYDRDFQNVLEEEFLQARLARALRESREPCSMKALAESMSESPDRLEPLLWDMLSSKSLGLVHKKGIAHYTLT